MPMAFRVRSSKFRHVYGSPFRKENCYENVKITRNAHDSNFCAVNPKFLAVVTESSGGGSFLVLPIEKTGRIDINSPKVCGHAGQVLDIKWSPFSDHIIASGSDDSSVKIWQIPDGGLHSNLTDWIVDLHGHRRRVTYLEWHPTSENILLSTGLDYQCILWNVEQAEPINIIEGHDNTILSISWNRDGSLFCTTCKDKRLRVIDPRIGDVVTETNCHPGVRASKSVFLGDTQKIFTTGFSRSSEREYAIWDVRSMSKSIRTETIDFSSGVLLPYYDHDSKVVFVAGKGDGNIRYYEVVDNEPYCHYLSQYQSSSPQRGLGVMPKRGCDVHKCEVVRFYKLHAAKNIIEPISMIVPRKSEVFQNDVFPPTASTIPSLSADEWISGQNREPILVSLQDGQVYNTPKITTSRAVQKQDGALLQGPTITTYKQVNNNNRGTDKHSTPLYPASPALVPQNRNLVSHVPASIKNIKQLSTSDDIILLGNEESETSTEPSPTDINNGSHSSLTEEDDENNCSVNDKIAAFEKRRSYSSPPPPSSPQKSISFERKVWSPTSPKDFTANGLSGSDNDLAEPTQSSSPQPQTSSIPLGLSSDFSIEIVETSPPLPTQPPPDKVADNSSEHVEMVIEDSNSSKPSERTFAKAYSLDSLDRTPEKSLSFSAISNRAKMIIGDTENNQEANNNESRKFHVRKVWSTPPPPSPVRVENGVSSFTESELRKAYFRQVEELKSLKEQISLKDKRIRQLEEELQQIRSKTVPGPGESDC